jgi:hypothetical protein
MSRFILVGRGMMNAARTTYHSGRLCGNVHRGHSLRSDATVGKAKIASERRLIEVQMKGFGDRLSDFAKRLDDFSSRLSSHDSIHISFFGTVVVLFGVTIKFSADLNNKIDNLSRDLNKEMKNISKEIHKNRSFWGFW